MPRGQYARKPRASGSITPPNPETVFSDKVQISRTDAEILAHGIANLRVVALPEEINAREFFDAWKNLQSRLKF